MSVLNLWILCNFFRLFFSSYKFKSIISSVDIRVFLFLTELSHTAFWKNFNLNLICSNFNLWFTFSVESDQAVLNRSRFVKTFFTKKIIIKNNNLLKVNNNIINFNVYLFGLNKNYQVKKNQTYNQFIDC